MSLQGTCHCGAVQWRFDGVPESATACNCTVCRRYGVLWIYDYEGEGIHVSGTTQAYVRGYTPHPVWGRDFTSAWIEAPR